MHYPDQGTISRFVTTILLAGLVWIGQPPATAAGAGAWQGSEPHQVGVDRTDAVARHDLRRLPVSPWTTNFAMIELLVEVCRGDTCREVSLLYDAYQMSLMTCMVMGQHEAARWQAANPAWRIRRWSCRFAQTAEKSI